MLYELNIYSFCLFTELFIFMVQHLYLFNTTYLKLKIFFLCFKIKQSWSQNVMRSVIGKWNNESVRGVHNMIEQITWPYQLTMKHYNGTVLEKNIYLKKMKVNLKKMTTILRKDMGDETDFSIDKLGIPK